MSRKEETSTTITWTSADKKATVDSMHRSIFRQCERAGAIETELESGVRKGRKIRRVFLVDKTFVRIQARRKLNLSEEARTKRLENLRPGQRHPTSATSVSNESRRTAAESECPDSAEGAGPAEGQNARLIRRPRKKPQKLKTRDGDQHDG